MQALQECHIYYLECQTLKNNWCREAMLDHSRGYDLHFLTSTMPLTHPGFLVQDTILSLLRPSATEMEKAASYYCG